MKGDITVQMLLDVYDSTLLGVSIILAAGGIGFAIGCGAVCGTSLECMVKRPDRRSSIMLDALIFSGFVGNFPFVILAFGAWFMFANPFVDSLQLAAKSLLEGTLF
ncbi:ATP synthase subunit c [Gammaproteobacteria bacterium]